MKSKTNKILILSSIVTIVGVIILYVAYNQIGKLNQKNNDLVIETNNLYAQALKAESLKKIVSNVGDKGISLDGYFVQAGEEVEFVKKIEALASSVNLNYTTNSISAVPNEKMEPLGKEYLEIAMTTEGSWQNTRRFFELLEKLPMNIKFNAVDLKTEIRTTVSVPTVAATVSSTTPAAQAPSRTIWRATITMVVVKKK